MSIDMLLTEELRKKYIGDLQGLIAVIESLPPDCVCPEFVISNSSDEGLREELFVDLEWYKEKTRIISASSNSDGSVSYAALIGDYSTHGVAPTGKDLTELLNKLYGE